MFTNGELTVIVYLSIGLMMSVASVLAVSRKENLHEKGLFYLMGILAAYLSIILFWAVLLVIHIATNKHVRLMLKAFGIQLQLIPPFVFGNACWKLYTITKMERFCDMAVQLRLKHYILLDRLKETIKNK